jgi:hypothetical protein
MPIAHDGAERKSLLKEGQYDAYLERRSGSHATNKEQGDDYQGNSGYPGMLVGDASQDGIQSQKIPLGHDVRWRGEWVGVDRVVWVAEGDWGSESNQAYTDGPHDSAHKVLYE